MTNIHLVAGKIWTCSLHPLTDVEHDNCQECEELLDDADDVAVVAVDFQVDISDSLATGVWLVGYNEENSDIWQFAFGCKDPLSAARSAAARHKIMEIDLPETWQVHPLKQRDILFDLTYDNVDSVGLTEAFHDGFVEIRL